MSSKTGEEPFLIVLVQEDGYAETVMLCGDSVTICEAPDLMKASLLLLAVYYLINLDYPTHYLQLLGLIQDQCLCEEFPVNLRGASFALLKNAL